MRLPCEGTKLYRLKEHPRWESNPDEIGKNVLQFLLILFHVLFFFLWLLFFFMPNPNHNRNCVNQII